MTATGNGGGAGIGGGAKANVASVRFIGGATNANSVGYGTGASEANVYMTWSDATKKEIQVTVTTYNATGVQFGAEFYDTNRSNIFYKKTYKKSIPATDSLDPWVTFAVIVDQSKGRKEIPLNELLNAPQNIGRVFNLDSITMLDIGSLFAPHAGTILPRVRSAASFSETLTVLNVHPPSKGVTERRHSPRPPGNTKLRCRPPSLLSDSGATTVPSARRMVMNGTFSPTSSRPVAFSRIDETQPSASNAMSTNAFESLAPGTLP